MSNEAHRALNALQKENGRRLLNHEELLTYDELAAIIDQETGIAKAMTVLSETMGEAVEGCSLLEAVSLLVWQRDNARRAVEVHAAEADRLVKELDRTAGIAAARHIKLREMGYAGAPILSDKPFSEMMREANAPKGDQQ